MPLFSLLFFILCLGNSGTPLTLNFVGEFLSLYGAFERMPLLGALACSSIVFSAAFTFFMYNRIAFGGSLSQYFSVNIPDLNKREYTILGTLVVFTVLFGIYPSVILDGLHFSVSTLIYNYSEPSSIALLLSLPIANKSGLSKLNLNPNSPKIFHIFGFYVSGFCDGESCFNIRIYKSSDRKIPLAPPLPSNPTTTRVVVGWRGGPIYWEGGVGRVVCDTKVFYRITWEG